MRALMVLGLVCGGLCDAAMIKTSVIHRALPNLVYQLDCVSGSTKSCSLEAYEPLWQSKFLTTDDDKAALAQWRALRSRYAQTVELPQSTPYPLGWRGGTLSLDSSVRRAGLLAKSIDEFASRIDLLMLPKDRDAMAAVLRRFEPRFRVWYQAQASSGDAFVTDLERLLTRIDVQNLINQFHAFYDSQTDGLRALPFIVLDRPVSASKHSFGEQIDGVSLIEVAPGEKASSRLDVVVHELCHFFFLSSRPETIAALQAQFVASKAPGALGAYRLFDEAVATALGNGIMGHAADRQQAARRLAEPMGFYNDPDIDRAAKALYPWLRQLPMRITDDGFVATYLELLSKEFGESLASPRLSMFQVLMFVDQRLALEVDRALHTRFHVNSSSSIIGLPDEPEVDPWFANGHGTGLFVVPVEALPELAKKKLITPADQKALTEAKGGAMVGKARANGDWLYVIVPSDQASLERAFDSLAAAQGPLAGMTRAP